MGDSSVFFRFAPLLGIIRRRAKCPKPRQDRNGVPPLVGSSTWDIIDTDLKLSKAYQGPDLKGRAFNAAKEVAATAGSPFVDSAGKMSTKLEDFLGKSARVDKETQTLFGLAKKLMGEIKKVDDEKVGADNARKVKEIGKETTDLLNQVGDLNKSIEGDNLLYRAYSARCKAYEDTNGKALGAASKLTTAAVIVAGIVAMALG